LGFAILIIIIATFSNLVCAVEISTQQRWHADKYR